MEWQMECIFISEEYKDQNQTQILQKNDVTVYIVTMPTAFSTYELRLRTMYKLYRTGSNMKIKKNKKKYRYNMRSGCL